MTADAKTNWKALASLLAVLRTVMLDMEAPLSDIAGMEREMLSAWGVAGDSDLWKKILAYSRIIRLDMPDE